MEVRATRDQIEEIKNSFFWKDIKRELAQWKIGFMHESSNIVDDAATNNPSTASVLLHMGDINGRIKTVEYLLSLPDIFLDLLEDKEDDS